MIATSGLCSVIICYSICATIVRWAVNVFFFALVTHLWVSAYRGDYVGAKKKAILKTNLMSAVLGVLVKVRHDAA